MQKKIKILLIRPGGYFVNTVFPDGPMISPPKGILYLSSVLNKMPNVQAKILDALAYPDFDLIAKNRKNPPVNNLVDINPFLQVIFFVHWGF